MQKSKTGKLLETITLRSEIITQLIPQKLFHVMITRISRNLARNNSSDIFWRSDKMAIAQIDSWKLVAYKNSMKAASKNRIAQSPRRQFPKSYLFHAMDCDTFAQSICGLNNSSIFFSRAQCFLNGDDNENSKQDMSRRNQNIFRLDSWKHFLDPLECFGLGNVLRILLLVLQLGRLGITPDCKQNLW